MKQWNSPLFIVSIIPRQYSEEINGEWRIKYKEHYYLLITSIENWLLICLLTFYIYKMNRRGNNWMSKWTGTPKWTHYIKCTLNDNEIFNQCDQTFKKNIWKFRAARWKMIICSLVKWSVREWLKQFLHTQVLIGLSLSDITNVNYHDLFKFLHEGKTHLDNLQN
jgi:hypothetical protein